MIPARASFPFDRALRTEAEPADDDRADKYRWRGQGPEPAKWWHADGTLVYRSYGDYCDD